MGRTYRQLSAEDRCEIARLHSLVTSLRQIAASLDRSPSTISRELDRNKSSKHGYQPVHAHERARALRWRGSRLKRRPELGELVLDRLKAGWSPEQVSGRLALEAGEPVISHESIYRFIYAEITRTNDHAWRHYLPRGKSKRGWRGRKGGSAARFIQQRVSIHDRPEEIATRLTPGHWEADLMLFRLYGQAILTLLERQSRLILAVRPPNKQADGIATFIDQILRPLPEGLRRSITFDNGTEFARHYQLHTLGIDTFFCDTHAPWQKGAVENAIGRMRRAIPRKTDLATLPDERFNAIVSLYNNTPRKCLDFKTPAELFCSQLLHFKCESISRPSAG